jgi:hypothetical protein
LREALDERFSEFEYHVKNFAFEEALKLIPALEV